MPTVKYEYNPFNLVSCEILDKDDFYNTYLISFVNPITLKKQKRIVPRHTLEFPKFSEYLM